MKVLGMGFDVVMRATSVARVARILAIALLAVAVGGVSAPARGQPGANLPIEWNTKSSTPIITSAGQPSHAAALGLAMGQGAVYDAVNAIEATSGASARATDAQPCEPSAAPPSALGNAVIDWNRIAQDEITTPPPQGAPPRPIGSSLVHEGIVQAAIYDATVAIEGRYEPFVASPSVTRPASTAAAIATAACRVLVDHVPDRASSVEDKYDAYLGAIPDGPAKDNGIAVGAQVGDAIVAWRSGDGLDADPDWHQPTPGPGVFEPYPAGTKPVDIRLADVTPLTLTSNDQFRPDGPNPLTSGEYAEDFNEVKAYGRVDSAVRTPEQTETALFWSDNTARQWPRAERALALDRGLDLAESARMLALAQVATADALLACFDGKYHYLSWRPVYAIRRADTDGNPATEADPTWTPLLNVNHPEYPGAHGCGTKAVTVALAAFFGTDRVAFSAESTVTGTTRQYERFRDAAKQVYDARTWAGLHFRNSTMEGAWIGRKVARYVGANFFQPVGTHVARAALSSEFKNGASARRKEGR